MLRFNRKQRIATSESLRQVGNLAVGGLVIGQFVGNRPLSLPLAIVGVTMWTMLNLLGIVLLAGDQE
jgi:hypothetical protein